MGVRHDYYVYLDENGYFQGFEARDGEPDTYNFDGSSLEDEFLQAYKIVDGQPFLDEERKAEIIVEREINERERQREEQRIPAQVAYTALETGTLLPEVEQNEGE